jgi:hypothetical protein
MRILRWIERRYLDLEFRAFKRKGQTSEDAWWFTFGNEAVGPCTLDDILDSLLDGCSPAAIVHASQSGENPVPWQPIRYRAWWANPVTAKVWTIGFWAACVVCGWFLVCLTMPLGAQGPAQLAYLLGIVGIFITKRRMSLRPLLSIAALLSLSTMHAAIRQFERQKVSVSGWSAELTAIVKHAARVSGYLGPVGAVGRFQFLGDITVLNDILKRYAGVPQTNHLLYLAANSAATESDVKHAGRYSFEISIAPGGEAFLHCYTSGLDLNGVNVPSEVRVEPFPALANAADPARQRECEAEQRRIEKFIAERPQSQ